MKKLFKEFKTFITRGNVVDLAVGMIIGAAFTAIVNALVNHIFKPLINWIPMGDISGLRTILGEAVYMKDEATGQMVVDWASTNFIDWGAFIMAIINFLLTAIVLFVLVKAINSLRSGMGGLKKDAEFLASLTNEEKASVGGKLTKKNLAKIKKAREEAAKAKAEAEAKAKAEAEAAKPTTEALLIEIRDLLAKK
ncbi:MAG: large conductance mechanosensitive channel protein MscL [Clostridia bacterium]|nr:large conductance mechanosensitive channel protein MscL [Clostridia bacterium]